MKPLAFLAIMSFMSISHFPNDGYLKKKTVESFRYFDLIRWKTAETELPKDILGVMLDRDVYPNVDRPLNSKGFIVLQLAETRSFDSGRDCLVPTFLKIK